MTQKILLTSPTLLEPIVFEGIPIWYKYNSYYGYLMPNGTEVVFFHEGDGVDYITLKGWVAIIHPDYKPTSAPAMDQETFKKFLNVPIQANNADWSSYPDIMMKQKLLWEKLGGKPNTIDWVDLEGKVLDDYKKFKDEPIQEGYGEKYRQQLALEPALTWNKYKAGSSETYPKVYGKYLITRKDGKKHWETWNGTGWAYNNNEIRYWAYIIDAPKD